MTPSVQKALEDFEAVVREVRADCNYTSKMRKDLVKRVEGSFRKLLIARAASVKLARKAYAEAAEVDAQFRATIGRPE